MDSVSCFNVQYCTVGVLEARRDKGEILFREDWRLPQGGSDVILSCNPNEIVHNFTPSPAGYRDWEAQGVQSSRADQSVGPTLDLSLHLLAMKCLVCPLQAETELQLNSATTDTWFRGIWKEAVLPDTNVCTRLGKEGFKKITKKIISGYLRLAGLRHSQKILIL